MTKYVDTDHDINDQQRISNPGQALIKQGGRCKQQQGRYGKPLELAL